MPYINQKYRTDLDPIIDNAAEVIVRQAKEMGYDGAFFGLLNYFCTRLALQIIKQNFGKLRYWLIAGTVGVFKNIGDEFYRRLGYPYEDKQIKENGDVDLYGEFEKGIK